MILRLFLFCMTMQVTLSLSQCDLLLLLLLLPKCVIAREEARRPLQSLVIRYSIEIATLHSVPLAMTATSLPLLLSLFWLEARSSWLAALVSLVPCH